MISNSGTFLPSFHFHSKKNDELSKGKSNDFDNPTKAVLEANSTKGLLETPQDKTPIFETCENVTGGLQEPSQVQGVIQLKKTQQKVVKQNMLKVVAPTTELAEVAADGRKTFCVIRIKVVGTFNEENDVVLSQPSSPGVSKKRKNLLNAAISLPSSLILAFSAKET
ncbi:hypothetical protein V6N11_050281 [Hibiscus sabdariffa]|uniref:Uncharacterized protein n=2 Tax=Hibiscus sabdariffa TaxID=183260 RepID=A0ABR2TAC4_9ROSI